MSALLYLIAKRGRKWAPETKLQSVHRYEIASLGHDLLPLPHFGSRPE
jgi:hypothetical protein